MNFEELKKTVWIVQVELPNCDESIILSDAESAYAMAREKLIWYALSDEECRSWLDELEETFAEYCLWSSDIRGLFGVRRVIRVEEIPIFKAIK